MRANCQADRPPGLRCRSNWEPGLPPGVCQADCEGRLNSLVDAGGIELWDACDFLQQESLSARFVDRYGDLVRDVLLEIQDSRNSQSPQLRFGSLLWPAWICFRDRQLREMLQRGELPGT